MKKIIYFVVGMMSILLGSCKENDDIESKPTVEGKISYSLLSEESGKQYFTKEKLHEQVTPYFIDLMMHKPNYQQEQWLEVTTNSIKPSSPEKQTYLDSIAEIQNKKLSALGIKLPLDKPIDLIDMSMDGFDTAMAFTAGTRIYAHLKGLQNADPNKNISVEEIMWHEVWHVLSRTNPELRRKMYALIGFTILDEEIEIPAEVKSHLLCNPDVERHDSYATFDIKGKPTDCLLLLYAEEDTLDSRFPKHLNNYTRMSEGSWLLALDKQTHKPYQDENGKWALIHVNYAENFSKVMGGNTPYNFDPEECMADNFAFAMMSKADAPNMTLLQQIRDLFK